MLNKKLNGFFKKLSFIMIAFIFGCAIPVSVPLIQHRNHFNIDSVPLNEGVIYFYREKAFVGGGRGIFIKLNEKRVGALNSGTYFVQTVAPGMYIVEAENALGENEKRTITVNAGDRYFIRGEIETGFWDALPRIEIISDIEGFNAIQSLTYATLE